MTRPPAVHFAEPMSEVQSPRRVAAEGVSPNAANPGLLPGLGHVSPVIGRASPGAESDIRMNCSTRVEQSTEDAEAELLLAMQTVVQEEAARVRAEVCESLAEEASQRKAGEASTAEDLKQLRAALESCIDALQEAVKQQKLLRAAGASDANGNLNVTEGASALLRVQQEEMIDARLERLEVELQARIREASVQERDARAAQHAAVWERLLCESGASLERHVTLLRSVTAIESRLDSEDCPMRKAAKLGLQDTGDDAGRVSGEEKYTRQKLAAQQAAILQEQQLRLSASMDDLEARLRQSMSDTNQKVESSIATLQDLVSNHQVVLENVMTAQVVKEQTTLSERLDCIDQRDVRRERLSGELLVAVQDLRSRFSEVQAVATQASAVATEAACFVERQAGHFGGPREGEHGEGSAMSRGRFGITCREEGGGSWAPPPSLQRFRNKNQSSASSSTTRVSIGNLSRQTDMGMTCSGYSGSFATSSVGGSSSVRRFAGGSGSAADVRQQRSLSATPPINAASRVCPSAAVQLPLSARGSKSPLSDACLFRGGAEPRAVSQDCHGCTPPGCLTASRGAAAAAAWQALRGGTASVVPPLCGSIALPGSPRATQRASSPSAPRLATGMSWQSPMERAAAYSPRVLQPTPSKPSPPRLCLPFRSQHSQSEPSLSARGGGHGNGVRRMIS